MLINLYIENYVLFDKQNLSFNSGFSSLTGDTGAGKSLIIDALGYLTGERLNVSINKDTDKNTFIEGQFNFTNTKTLNLLKNSGIDFEAPFIVSREIMPDGRSISRINQRSVTLGFIKDVFANELDIHSQRDTQYLLNKNIHINLLDSFANHEDLVNDVNMAFKQYSSVKSEIKQLNDSVFNEDEIEFTKSQIMEIEKVNATNEEIEKLSLRLKEINNFEDIFNNLSLANSLLTNNKGIIESMYEAKEGLLRLDDYDDYKDIASRMDTSYFEVVDVSHEIASLLSSLEFDEFELNNIEARLYEINHLLKKYGGSVETASERLALMKTKVEKFEFKEVILSKLEKELKEKANLLDKAALKLRLSRQKSIDELEKQVIKNLQDLHLIDAQFKIDLVEKPVSKDGFDDVEFLVAMNKGSSLQPLIKVASGGELSRLMLGLKVIFSELFGISTVIFDEIDSGVSGAIATAIGVKMHSLSKTSQVFAVTHLAQVAACSDYHFHVEKNSDGFFTNTSVKMMDEKEKVEKLAVMSTGLMSEASINAAKELFSKSQSLVKGING